MSTPAPKMMRCCCCKAWYERGKFQNACCGPRGMSAEHWLSLACKKVEHGGCGKCYRHCICPDKADREQKPLRDLGDWARREFAPKAKTA